MFELKFSDAPYVMNATEAEKLLQRRKVLDTEFRGTRSIIVCLLSPAGAQKNPHLKASVDLVLDCDALLDSA